MYKFPPVYKYPITRPRSAVSLDKMIDMQQEPYVILSFIITGRIEKCAIYRCMGCADVGRDWRTPWVLNEEHFLEVTKEHALDHQYIGEWGYYKWKR